MPPACLGADVGWHLPSRFEEGYGVSRTPDPAGRGGCARAHRRLRDHGRRGGRRGAGGQARGDRDRPPPARRDAPDCPIVATRPNYPFPELCGIGVVFKLLEALGVEGLDRHVDLVALATVADVVPLLDENRALVAAACAASLGRTSPACRPSCVSGVDPSVAGAVAFRLAPGINAAGPYSDIPARPSSCCSPATRPRPGGLRASSRLSTGTARRSRIASCGTRSARSRVARTEARALRLRHRRKGLASRRHRHRRPRLVERFFAVVLIAAGAGAKTGSAQGASVSSFDLHGALGACACACWGAGAATRAAAGLSDRARGTSPPSQRPSPTCGDRASFEDLRGSRRSTPSSAAAS